MCTQALSIPHICKKKVFSQNVLFYFSVTFLTDLIISISDYVMIRSRVCHVVFYCFATHVDLSLLIIVVENRYISQRNNRYCKP